MKEKTKLSIMASGLVTFAFSWYIICILLMGGCKRAEESSKWTKYYSGAIAEIFFFEDGSRDWFWEVQINFVDGKVIRMDRLQSEDVPTIGEIGILWVKSYYADRSDSSIQNGDFKWAKEISQSVRFLSKKKESSTEIISRTMPIPTTLVLKTVITWKDPYSISPVPHVTVLVKLENGIITTAYLTQRGDWKAELFKNKMSGGTSLRDVEAWKEVDLQ